MDSDHGKRGLSCSIAGVSPSLGSSCSRNSRYPKGSRPFRFAVSIILKHSALASAPFEVSQNRKFLRDITKGFTVRSARLLVSVRRPSSRTLSRASLPPRTEDEKYIVLPFFWIPEDTIPLRVRRASVPYDVWKQQGYLLATEGNVIHYGFIEKFIEDLGKQYHILEIAFDRWGATQMVQDLEGMGFTVVPFGQGFKDMSPPTKEFYKLLMEGKIIHGGNPVLRWMAGNVVVDRDPAENIKPTKAKSPEKIDGIVATIMALDRCIRNQGQQGSVYDERPLIVF